MNERIKQLAEQAREYAREHVAECNRGWYTMEYNEYELQFEAKFAQLIVADAIETVERRFTGDLNREDMEVRRCVADLKQHFGVKD